MKKFRFPLRSVTTVRTLAELRARERFSDAVHAYAAAEQHLAALRRRVAELEEILLSGRTHRFRPADEAAFLEAFKLETVAAAKAEIALNEARSAMETARTAWLESRRDLRLMENLEGKARQHYRRDCEREEQAALDDRTNALAARTAAREL